MANGIFDSNVAGTPAVSATGTNGADGINATSDNGAAITGSSTTGDGIRGITGGDPANTAVAVRGLGGPNGVQGVGDNFGVVGQSTEGVGISGSSADGTGVLAESNTLLGLHAVGGGATLTPPNAPAAIFAEGGPNTGIIAFNNSTTANAIEGNNASGSGVVGSSNGSSGVVGNSNSGIGVDGSSSSGYGMRATGGDIGIFAANLTARGNSAYLGTRGLAGDFYGEVFFHNKITKLGGGFQIDHPLDPENKYLSHSFVESPDMKNIYDGVAVLDGNGEAEVVLPSWFDALNTEFRYQLTCLGGYAPVYIAQEISANRFKIAGGKPRMKVSWQVSGNRQDAWANAHRVQVEIEKPVEEQGYYLAPELHGASEEKSIRQARYPKLK